MSRLIGYYGTLAIMFVAIPVVLVWIVAGLLLQIQFPLILVLYVLTPVAVFWAWSIYIARRH